MYETTSGDYFPLKAYKYALRATCWVHEVKMADPIGGDQGVMVDDGRCNTNADERQ